MKLIVGLGNPEQKYTHTRHNIGFSVLDALADGWGGEFQSKPKFSAAIAEVTIAGGRVLLVKPTTYYNDTGVSVRALMDFYKLTIDDLLVIHDDTALDFGKVRIRQGGSDAGNNGLKSLHQHIGQDFWHIRIGTDSLIHRQMNNVDFVLGKFNQDESKILADWTIPTAITISDSFLTGTIEATSYVLPDSTAL